MSKFVHFDITSFWLYLWVSTTNKGYEAKQNEMIFITELKLFADDKKNNSSVKTEEKKEVGGRGSEMFFVICWLGRK